MGEPTRIQDFLTTLHKSGPWRNLWSGKTKLSAWRPASEPLPDTTGRADLYFGVHPVTAIPATDAQGQPAAPKRVRSRLDCIAAVNALFAEFDAKDFDPDLAGIPEPQRTADARAVGLARALKHIDGLDTPPSAIVHSGGGFHCYWLLSEPWILDTPEDREAARRLQVRWVGYVQGDPGAKDLARILRLPGTVNAKYPDRPRVELAEWHPERTYERAALEALLPPEDRSSGHHGGGSGRPAGATKATDIARAAAALEQLATRRRDEYAAWLEVGMALYDLGDIGLAMWEDWSQGSPKYEPGACAAKWETFSADRLNRLTLGSLIVWGREDAGDLLHVGTSPKPPSAEPPEEPEYLRDAPALEDPPQDSDGPPVIVVNNRQLPAITTEALYALMAANDPPTIFVRAGQLVRVEHDEHNRPVIRLLGLDALAGELARSARFVRVNDKEEERSVLPPGGVVRDVAALPYRPFPRLAGIIEAPTIRPDGTILSKPGYDTATGLFYDPPPGLQVPPILDNPSREDINAALEVLHDLLWDFPFKDAASQAHAYALILTPLLRPYIRGHVPFILVDKPQAGTGAGLLTELAALTATGRPAALMTAPDDEAEWRKVLTALLIEGASFITIDNIEGRLASAVLAAVITALMWRGRVLGRSETVEIALSNVSWCGTGNNVQLGGDLPRRTIWIRMDSAEEHPWQRTGFKHEKLLEHAEKQRGEIVAAALTLTRGWIAAGAPGPAEDCPALGSFEHWRAVIGGILHYANVQGFMANVADMLANVDSDAPAWGAFFAAWHAAYGETPKTLSEVGKDLRGDTLSPELTELLNAVPAYIGAPTDRGFTRSLGNAFSHQADVHHKGGWVLEKRGTIKHAIRWAVTGNHTGPQKLDPWGRERLEEGESSESSESVSPRAGKKGAEQVGEINIAAAGSDSPDSLDSPNGNGHRAPEIGDLVHCLSGQGDIVTPKPLRVIDMVEHTDGSEWVICETPDGPRHWAADRCEVAEDSDDPLF